MNQAGIIWTPFKKDDEKENNNKEKQEEIKMTEETDDFEYRITKEAYKLF